MRGRRQGATSDPGGVTTVVLCEGGGGLLLLKERHPARASGSNKMIQARRMEALSEWVGISGARLILARH